MNGNGRMTQNQAATLIIGVVLTALVATQAWAFKKIVDNGERIAENVPPEWLVDRLDRMEAKIDKIGSD